MQETQISSAEWEIMRVVWATERTTSSEMSAVLSEKMQWKPATVKTLLGRLVKKGLLTTTQEGRKHVYSATISEEESVEEASKELLSQVCSKKVGATIASMVEESVLSQEDITQLEKILAYKKKNAPETVACNCTPGQCACHIDGHDHH